MKTLIPENQTGFTLIEVLLGMSIMSIMMLLLFASLRVCVQNWNAGEKKIAQVSQAAIVQNFLQNKLQTTLPLDADFLEEQQFSFQGEQEFIQFVATMPASASRLGLQLFKLSLEETADKTGSELQVEIQPFFPQGDAEEWREEKVVILPQIQSLRFAYFGIDNGATEDEDGLTWQDEWLDRKTLPRLVSIDIQLTNGEVWPQLVVALKIDKMLTQSTGNKSASPLGIVDGKFVSP